MLGAEKVVIFVLFDSLVPLLRRTERRWNDFMEVRGQQQRKASL